MFNANVKNVYRLTEVGASSTQKKTIAHDDVTHGAIKGMQDIGENHLFGNANRINSVNFNATSLKLAEKFDHTFSHLFIFRNIFAQSHGFDHGGMINRWSHQKTSTLDDVIARNGT